MSFAQFIDDCDTRLLRGKKFMPSYCGPQKLGTKQFSSHITVSTTFSGSCPIRACRNSSKQVPRMDKESGVPDSILIKGLIAEIDFEDRPLSKMV